jgi:hypothetical protein
MPSKADIQAELARLRRLPQTPARLREIQALERCLGLEIRPGKKSGGKKAARQGPRVVRKRAAAVEDDDEDEKSERTPRRTDFNAADYLGDLLGSHHRGMS